MMITVVLFRNSTYSLLAPAHTHTYTHARTHTHTAGRTKASSDKLRQLCELLPLRDVTDILVQVRYSIDVLICVQPHNGCMHCHSTTLIHDVRSG